MAVISKTNLKEYFNKGDKPTENQFIDLIDSFMHAESSEFVNITSSGFISASNIISSTSSLNLIQPTQDALPNIIVSGNLVPVPDVNSFTSSFSLGSETAAWKDLFVSEDSIKFIRQKSDGTSEVLASIQIDKESQDQEVQGTAEVLKFQHPDGRRMDLESGVIQVGKDRSRGFLFAEPDGHIGSIFGKMQNYIAGTGKGQQLLMRPESEGLAFLGRKYKSHLFNAQGGANVTFGLQNFDGDKNGFFRIEKDTSIAGAGTALFEISETLKHKVHGVNSKFEVEGTIQTTGGTFTGGNTVIEEAVTVQPGIISQSFNIGTTTSPSNLEMVGVGDDNSIKISDAIYQQVTEITFPFNGVRTSSLQDTSLAASGAFYFKLPDETFHTFAFGNYNFESPSSQISGSLKTGSLSGNYSLDVVSGSSGISTGEMLALLMDITIGGTTGFSTIREINKLIITLDSPGPVIAASTTFPSTTASLSTTIEGLGAEVRVHDGSTLRIISQQPNVIADSNTGTITLTDPTIDGGGDITFSPNNGGNPTVLLQNTTIPANQISYWTVGAVNGTFTQAANEINNTPSDNDLDDTGIQIGASAGVIFEGISINGQFVDNFSGTGNPNLNIKLRVQDGAKLYIQSATQVVPTDDGTNITGTTTFDVQSEENSVDISGAEGITLNVSGGDTSLSGVTASIDFSQLSMDIEQGGFFGLAVSGSTAASNNHNMANNLSGLFLTGSNVIVSGSISLSGSTVITGGDTEITGSAIFSSDSDSLPSGFISDSEPTGSSEVVVEGDIEVAGSIIENYTNNVPVSASMLLTTALHGQGKQLFIRSGSAAVDASTGGGGLPAGLPVGNGIYTSTSPAGNMIITLPSASVGMSFHIINHNSPSNVAPFIGNQYGPSLHVHPSGSQRFAFSADGDPGVAGKAIINHSGSMQTGDFVKVYCISSTAPQWMIFQTGGTWVDEA